MNRIARVTTSGHVKEFQIIVPHGQPAMMTLGADGSVWFTQPQAGKIGRITPDGYVTEFPLPAAGVPLGIASGVDKNLWVTVIRAQVIYRLTPSGEFAAFPMPAKLDGYFHHGRSRRNAVVHRTQRQGRPSDDRWLRQGICLLESIQRTSRKLIAPAVSVKRRLRVCSVRQVLRYKRSITRTKTLGAFGFRHYAAREN